MMKTVTAMLVALLVVTVSEAQTTSDNLVGYSKGDRYRWTIITCCC